MRGLLYVDGYKLGAMVQAWIDAWDLAHDIRQWNGSGVDPKGVGGERVPTMMTAYQALTLRSKRCGRAVTPIMIYRLTHGRRARVKFYETADPLCCAMGHPEVFLNGLLPVLDGDGAESPPLAVAA